MIGNSQGEREIPHDLAEGVLPTGKVFAWTLKGQEDVKKLISFSFRDFIFDPKCLPTAQRSLIGHPRAIFLHRVHCKFQNRFFHIFQTE
jgi:hypothetical protein